MPPRISCTSSHTKLLLLSCVQRPGVAVSVSVNVKDAGMSAWIHSFPLSSPHCPPYTAPSGSLLSTDSFHCSFSLFVVRKQITLKALGAKGETDPNGKIWVSFPFGSSFQMVWIFNLNIIAEHHHVFTYNRAPLGVVLWLRTILIEFNWAYNFWEIRLC